jgi:hypothetical protein
VPLAFELAHRRCFQCRRRRHWRWSRMPCSSLRRRRPRPHCRQQGR